MRECSVHIDCIACKHSCYVPQKAIGCCQSTCSHMQASLSMMRNMMSCTATES